MASYQLKEQTFRAYKPGQARAYADGRGSYPAAVLDTVLDFHSATGGQFDLYVDVGCGPGNSTRDIAPQFEKATGIDGSAELIATARERADHAAAGPIVYHVINAEDCDQIPQIPDESVDLLTAAMAAHWFNMDLFWQSAAKILKPGGTVALWTCASMYCHPSTPNAAEVQKILFDLERGMLAPFETPGNRLSRDMYDKIGLPWTVSPKVDAFDPADHVRKEWNRDGHVGDDGVFLMAGEGPTTLTKLEQGLGTASMVTRWREANPGLAHTSQDCVKITMERLREALGGATEFVEGGALAMLLFKKKKI